MMMMIAITAVCRVEYSICGSGTASDDDEMMILMMMMIIIIIMATTLMMMTAILGMMTCVPGAIASLHSCRICSHRGQGCVGSVRPGHHGDWCQQGQQYRWCLPGPTGMYYQYALRTKKQTNKQKHCMCKTFCYFSHKNYVCYIIC